MIYHLLIIKHFVKVKMNIIHQISWVKSLNNELFYRIDSIEQTLKMLGHVLSRSYLWYA